MNNNSISVGPIARIMLFAAIAIFCAGGLAACRTHRPPLRSSAGFVVLRNTPAFLDPAPFREIDVDIAYFSYGPSTELAPLLVLEEFRTPVKLDREPTNPIQWVGPPPGSTALSYGAIFKCGELTVQAGVFFPSVDALKSATAQLDTIAEELSARCAELEATSSPSAR